MEGKTEVRKVGVEREKRKRDRKKEKEGRKEGRDDVKYLVH